MKSYFNPNQRKKKDLRVCGDQSWVLCYRNFPFQTQTTHSSMWAKKAERNPRRAWRNNTSSFNPERSVARFSGKAVQRVWIRSHLDVWDWNDDDGSSITGHNFRELPKMPLGKRGNFSVTQFPISEDEINTSEFVESSKKWYEWWYDNASYNFIKQYLSLAFTEALLCMSHCVKAFLSIISFNSHHSMRSVVLFFQFCIQGNYSLEKLKDWLEQAHNLKWWRWVSNLSLVWLQWTDTLSCLPKDRPTLAHTALVLSWIWWAG